MKPRYVEGDATYPQGEGNKIIVHCCNDIGVWGAGFVLAISKRWKTPEQQYLQWAEACKSNGTTINLGSVEVIEVEDDIAVANLIGQKGVGWKDGKPPVSYPAISIGLDTVAAFAAAVGASVHMPRMGAGLAGGDWGKIEEIVQKKLCDRGIEVTVYDLPKRS